MFRLRLSPRLLLFELLILALAFSAAVSVSLAISGNIEYSVYPGLIEYCADKLRTTVLPLPFTFSLFYILIQLFRLYQRLDQQNY